MPVPPTRWTVGYDNQACWDATLKYIDAAVEADRLGYDSFWTTEHHFQYEGYEVIPNGILVSAWIAARTSNIRLGAMFNVVPQWNPLRLAEDFATHAQPQRWSRHPRRGPRHRAPRDPPPQRLPRLDRFARQPRPGADDAKNREYFEEQMEIIRMALTQETFSFNGKYFQLPVPGIPDRGETVQELTLVPRPIYPFEIWQAATSPPTVEYTPKVEPRRGVLEPAPDVHQAHVGPLRRGARGSTHGPGIQRHEQRMLVVSVRIEDTHEEAMRTARNGHDEFWKFLGPYGWSRGYMGEDGRPVKPGLIPTLEESMQQTHHPRRHARGGGRAGAGATRTCSASSTSRCSRTSSATRTARRSSRWSDS